MLVVTEPILVTFPVVLVSRLSAAASTATIGLVKEAKKGNELVPATLTVHVCRTKLAATLLPIVVAVLQLTATTIQILVSIKTTTITLVAIPIVI